MVRPTKTVMIGIALLVLGGPGLLASQFLDVPQGIWYEGAVSNLKKLGLVEGYQGVGGRYFRPAQLVTRAEFLRLCLRALVKGGLRDFLDYPPSGPPFPDVPVDAWFAPDVAFAKEWGVVDRGLAAFEPNRAITRAEAAEMISRTMAPVPVRGYRGFSDVSAGSFHIRRVYEAGIADGYGDGTFRPSRALIRAEAAVLIERAYFTSILPPVIGLKMSVFSPWVPFLSEVQVAPALGVARIRLNNPVSSDNLVRVEIWGNPTDLNTGVRYYLRRSDSLIRVWRERERTSAPLLGPNSEQEIAEAELRGGMELWVENTDAGEVDLILEARRASDGGVIESERFMFKTFRSVVVVIGGRNQHPELYDPEHPSLCSGEGCGIFATGEKLYWNGYDVWLFDQENVHLDGRGATYDFIRQAIEQRGVHELAIIAYSWGGGALYDLIEVLAEDSGLGGAEVVYTAYIDAIKSATNLPEMHRPDSKFHLNLTQIRSCISGDLVPLCGWPYMAADGLVTENIPVNNEDWGNELSHYSIDDDPAVYLKIFDTLKERVQP